MPFMDLSGDTRRDWPVLLGYMHSPKDTQRAAAIASLANMGEDAVTQGNNTLVQSILDSQIVTMRKGDRDDRLKGKPDPVVGMLAGDVLLTALSVEVCARGMGNSYVAAHLLEKMRERGEWIPFDDCTIPKNRDTWRHAFYAFRPVAHLWAAKRIFLNNCIVGKFDPANLSEMVGDKIQERFGYFLGIAESICNIAERQITRGKMLMPHNVAWRVPLTIELEAPPIIDMPELNVHDLESYFRQDR